MPDQLNKQSLINLLIDSPLREPIKINLIDIVNNTSDPDLPKVYSTITKELEIFQKATERRMKLAEETIAKLSGGTPATPAPTPVAPPSPTQSVPPLDLPPVPPTPPTPPSQPSPVEPPIVSPEPSVAPLTTPPLSVPPLDLPPLPVSPSSATTTETNSNPAPESTTTPLPPLGQPAPTMAGEQGDEAALAEIQKELESLKSSVTADATTPVPPPTPVQQ